MTDRPGLHTKSYVCFHVWAGHPVLLVSRPGGEWCVLCGGMHADDASEYRVAGIGHLLERDTSLEALLDLPAEWEAERVDATAPWVRRRIEDAPD